jgi:hypothetical protein
VALQAAAAVGSSASHGSNKIYRRGADISLLSFSGGVVSGPGGAELGAAAASHAASSLPRASVAIERAVCFLTPRTQAAAAADTSVSVAAAAAQHASFGAAAAHSIGLQRLHEGSVQHNTHLPQLPAKPAAGNGNSSSSGAAAPGNGSTDGASDQKQQQQQPTEEQQVWLVQSACKALGSAAAAEAYVASLPADAESVNFSASGRNA